MNTSQDLRLATRGGLAALGLSLAAGLAAGQCGRTTTFIGYDITIDVNWTITFNCAYDGTGSAAATAASVTTGTGDCSCLSIGLPEANSFSGLGQTASASSGSGCGNAGASATHLATAGATGRIFSSTTLETWSDVCRPGPNCPEYQCIELGIAGGSASANMLFVASDPPCPKGLIDTFLIEVHIDIEHEREYTSSPSCSFRLPGDIAGSTPPATPNESSDAFASVTVRWGDASGETGSSTYQGIVDLENNTYRYAGALFGGDLVGGPGAGGGGGGQQQFAYPCPIGGVCGEPYDDIMMLAIPVAVPASATWVSVAADAIPLEDLTEDTNQDGQITFDDRTVVTLALGSVLGDAEYTPRADLDRDGDVDAADAAIMDDTPCVADVDGNGSLDFNDANAFVSLFSAADPSADLNGDGSYDIDDINAYLAMYSTGCS